MSLFDNLKGICLGTNARWVVHGLSAFEPFFRNLDQLLPESPTVVYLEGTTISSDVRRFLEQHSVTPWHEVYPGTVWPKPSIFSLPTSSQVLSGLEDLASHHVNPEIADHCHVYTKDGMILQWYDACDAMCPLSVGPTIPEEKVKAFCGRTGTKYSAYTNG